MRLQRYINEKFYDAMRVGGILAGDYEIFVNPSRKELKEASGQDGYRFVIDFRNKKVYVFNALAFHEDMMNFTPELPKFNYYWNMTTHHHEIFTGNVWKSGNPDSDALYGIYSKKKILELLEQDWSWVKKYLPSDAIQDMLKKRVKDYA